MPQEHMLASIRRALRALFRRRKKHAQKTTDDSASNATSQTTHSTTEKFIANPSEQPPLPSQPPVPPPKDVRTPFAAHRQSQHWQPFTAPVQYQRQVGDDIAPTPVSSQGMMEEPSSAVSELSGTGVSPVTTASGGGSTGYAGRSAGQLRSVEEDSTHPLASELQGEDVHPVRSISGDHIPQVEQPGAVQEMGGVDEPETVEEVEGAHQPDTTQEAERTSGFDHTSSHLIDDSQASLVEEPAETTEPAKEAEPIDQHEDEVQVPHEHETLEPTDQLDEQTRMPQEPQEAEPEDPEQPLQATTDQPQHEESVPTEAAGEPVQEPANEPTEEPAEAIPLPEPTQLAAASAETGHTTVPTTDPEPEEHRETHREDSATLPPDPAILPPDPAEHRAHEDSTSTQQDASPIDSKNVPSKVNSHDDEEKIAVLPEGPLLEPAPGMHATSGPLQDFYMPQV